jgi:hypothetical protein
MESRVSIPVTLPRSIPTLSYWQDPPDAEIADYLHAGIVPTAVNTVIIGSGITGTSAAWGLLGGDDENGAGGARGGVVMLEARQACSGATGRNGILHPLVFDYTGVAKQSMDSC